MSSDLTLDWFRLGYRYRFAWDDPDTARPVFSISPSIGVDLLDFHYRLQGDGERADRGYIKGGLQIGAEAEWMVTDRFSIDAELLAPVPIPNTPSILKAQLAARYAFLQVRDVDLAGLLGVAYERIEYEDNQQLPNHVDVGLGPMLVVGFEARF